jgi:diadenosine tetraphosphate (Ap4A) HIT family hydrolase
MKKCIGCSLKNEKSIFSTKLFEVRQDYETPIPGFMIISSKKHIKGIEDLSLNERKEFIELLYDVRKALTKVLKIEYVYMIQKEDTIISRSHFHFWLFPRYGWMDKFGNKISSVTSIIEYARKNMKDDINKIEEINIKIKKYLDAQPSTAKDMK